MAFPNLDPNFVREQQQLLRMQGLKRAKNTAPVSGKKALIIILTVFVVALVITLYGAGVFDEGHTFSWNGAVYRLPSDMYAVKVGELPKGYVSVGKLESGEENPSANWSPDAKVFAKAGNDRVIYIFINSPKPEGYFKARKKLILF